MTKRVFTSGVIIIIMAVLAIFMASIYILPVTNAYADEPTLPTTEWAASASLGGSGSAANPYLITKPQDLAYLANAVGGGNSFENKYFSLENDLYMNGFLTKPIGSYTNSSDNRPFKGIFEGNGNTLYSLIINKGDSERIGFFGYLGDSGIIRNLVIDEESIVIGGRYTASVVGQCEGSVEGVLSYATVQSGGIIGGIVGNARQCSITNSIFMGNLNSEDRKNGIAGNVTLSTFNGSWYITDNFNYVHTDHFGNVLYLGSNGRLTPLIEEGQISFLLTPSSGFAGEIRTADETVISLENQYYPSESLTDAVYFARFVKSVSVASVQNGTVTGSGTYYVGQRVRIAVKANEGYYFDSISCDITPEDASYSNGIDNSVIYSFTMQSASMQVTASIKQFSPAPSAIVNNFIYDGTSKVATSENQLQLSNPSYQAFSFNVTCFSQVQGTLPSPPSTAGDFTAIVTIYNNLGGENINIGEIRYPYTISPAQLEIDGNIFELPITKEYDNQAVKQMVIDSDAFQVIGNDEVNMRTNIIYYVDSSRTQVALARGENYFVEFTFIIDGQDSANYMPPTPIIVSNGKIIEKEALISIDERYLKKVYNDSPPSIIAYDVDSIGGIDISFIFTNLENEGSNSDVGLYSISVQFNPDKINPNNDNHTLRLAENYVFEIIPKSVSVVFSGYNNLKYTGEEQSITAIHDTIYAQINLPANIRYEMDGVEVPLLNAGNYTAYATSASPNYVIVGGDTCTFSVAKIHQTDTLMVEQIADTVYHTAATELATIGGNGEGEVSFELISGKASIDGGTLILLGGGVVEIIAFKAEGQNYFSAQSEIMSFTVTKAQLTVRVAALINTIVYNDVLELEVEYSGFVEGEEGLLQPVGLVRPTILLAGSAYVYNTNIRLDVSTQGYEITLAGGSSDAYEIVPDNSIGARLFVEKRSLTVRANAVQKIYGQADPTLTYTIDEGNYTLSGSLSRESGVNAGEYAIYQSTLNEESNPNFALTFYPAVFTITRAPVTIRPANKSKAYGESDPIVEYQIIGLIPPDTCEVVIEREEGESPGFYLYLLVEHTLSDNYTLAFNDQNRGLTINTILPILSLAPERTTIIYGQDLTESEFSDGIVRAVTNEGDRIISGVYLWDEEDIIMPTTADSNITLYLVRFIPDDEVNYKQITFECTVTVEPKPFSIIYSGAQQLVYNGKVQKLVSGSPQGIIGDDEINFDIRYSGEMIDVGTYEVTPYFDNANYTLQPDSASYTVSITRKALKVTLNGATYDDDKVSKPSFTYTGFVEGESEQALSQLPTADMPDKAGTYTIMPYGGQAHNYQISYAAGKIIVKQSVLYTQDENIVAIGSYDASISFEAETFMPDTARFEEFKADFKAFKLGKQEFNGISIKRGYSFTFMDKGSEIAPGEQPITIRIKIPANLSRTRNFVVLFYGEDGEIEVVQDAKRDGEYLVITTDKMGEYVFATNNDYTIFVILIITISLIALFVILDMGIRRRKRTSGQSAKSGYQKRYQNAYRQAKRDRKSEQRFEKMKTREAKRREKQFKYVRRDDIF